ncbi:MAG: hypothetical protein GXY92_02055 [Syntrophomonadaceae bacterium]|nr:hypothetical protein [Syntrophomonadaceae bacterium]
MYQFICPKCGGRSYSASRLSTLKNPECPYCRSPLAQESQEVSDIAPTAENDAKSIDTKPAPDHS